MYYLFVFSIFKFRFHEIGLVCFVHFFKLYYRILSCFSSTSNFAICLSKDNWVSMYFGIYILRLCVFMWNTIKAKPMFFFASCLICLSATWASRKWKCQHQLGFTVLFCNFDSDVLIITNYQLQNVNGIRIWGTLWNSIEGCVIKLLILGRLKKT